MSRSLTAAALGAVMAVFSAGVQAADAVAPTERARSSPVFTIYIENDAFSGTDQHYTNGVKLSWLSADLVDWGQTGWRKTVVDILPFVNRPQGQKNVGFAFGQNIYTPRDTRARNPDPADRPYAGWSYLELAFVSKTPSIADTLSFQVGIIGPHSLAEDAQRTWHQLIDIQRPRGWDYQLRDEMGVNVVYERRWRMYGRALSQTIGIDFVPHAGASLGNVQTYANAGGTVRLGFNLPSDFGVQLARPGSLGGTPTDDLDPRVAMDRNFSFFVFGAGDGRAVGRDIFLDGNTFRDSRSVDKRPFVADLSAGAGLIAGRWQLTYTQVWRSREFRSQREARNNFGSFSISRAY
ncbi:lipid A deacylase LpxR family protein [Horticoccus sp. 23ND18S-11]|uniref:lipid A deacylase LpxR family protein n=1 Tax=Horticoccus sp. 23ND18S-11 TaxID=3391832 RepID=UPI0039C8E61F